MSESAGSWLFCSGSLSWQAARQRPTADNKAGSRYLWIAERIFIRQLDLQVRPNTTPGRCRAWGRAVALQAQAVKYHEFFLGDKFCLLDLRVQTAAGKGKGG